MAVVDELSHELGKQAVYAGRAVDLGIWLLLFLIVTCRVATSCALDVPRPGLRPFRPEAKLRRGLPARQHGMADIIYKAGPDAKMISPVSFLRARSRK